MMDQTTLNNFEHKDVNMGREGLIKNDIDPQAWRGYVAGLLESMSQTIDQNKEEAKEDIDRVSSSVEKILDKLDKLNSKISSHDDCGIEQLKSTIYGDPENKTEGLISMMNRLASELRIKSGYWGVMGGMIPIIIVIVIGVIKAFAQG